MSTSIRLVYNRLPELSSAMERAAGRVCVSTALRVAREAKRSMSEPKHGRLYRRGNRSHRASAPGEAPAIDTGNLINSIGSGPMGKTSAIVWASAEYAEVLEMRRNRQFFTPAVEKLRLWFVAEMSKAIGRVR